MCCCSGISIDGRRSVVVSRHFAPSTRPLIRLPGASPPRLPRRLYRPERAVPNGVDEQGEPIGALGDGEAVWHTDMSYAAQPPDVARPIRSASVDRHEPVSAFNETKQRSVARASDITASSFRFRALRVYVNEQGSLVGPTQVVIDDNRHTQPGLRLMKAVDTVLSVQD